MNVRQKLKLFNQPSTFRESCAGGNPVRDCHPILGGLRIYCSYNCQQNLLKHGLFSIANWTHPYSFAKSSPKYTYTTHAPPQTNVVLVTDCYAGRLAILIWGVGGVGVISTVLDGKKGKEEQKLKAVSIVLSPNAVTSCFRKWT